MNDDIREFAERLKVICENQLMPEIKQLLEDMIKYRDNSGIGGSCSLLNALIDSVNGFLWQCHQIDLRKQTNLN